MTSKLEKVERKFCYNCGASGHFGHVCILLCRFIFTVGADSVLSNTIMLVRSLLITL